MTLQPERQVEILLVEDDPGDVLMTREAFEDYKVRNQLHVVSDGADAMAFLRQEGEYADRPRPDLVLLDLNLPRMDGREVLEAIKSDPELSSIPVVVLTTSEAEDDVLRSYSLHANAYVTKPVDFERFIEVVRQIDDFFVTVVRLPRTLGPVARTRTRRCRRRSTARGAPCPGARRAGRGAGAGLRTSCWTTFRRWLLPWGSRRNPVR